jgi:hypothetical protein
MSTGGWNPQPIGTMADWPDSSPGHPLSGVLSPHYSDLTKPPSLRRPRRSAAGRTNNGRIGPDIISRTCRLTDPYTAATIASHAFRYLIVRYMLVILLELMWRHLFFTLPIAVLIVAFLQSSSSLRNRPSLTQLRNLLPLFAKRNLTTTTTHTTPSNNTMGKTPVYFFSHGGVSPLHLLSSRPPRF